MIHEQAREEGGQSRRSFLARLTAVLLMGGSGRTAAESPEKCFHADDPHWLASWKAARRLPIRSTTNDPLVAELLRAAASGEALPIRYFAGTTPARKRTITPHEVFDVEGFPGRYLSAWCHTRQAHRTFELEAIELSPIS